MNSKIPVIQISCQLLLSSVLCRPHCREYGAWTESGSESQRNYDETCWKGPVDPNNQATAFLSILSQMVVKKNSNWFGSIWAQLSVCKSLLSLSRLLRWQFLSRIYYLVPGLCFTRQSVVIITSSRATNYFFRGVTLPFEMLNPSNQKIFAAPNSTHVWLQ